MSAGATWNPASSISTRTAIGKGGCHSVCDRGQGASSLTATDATAMTVLSPRSRSIASNHARHRLHRDGPAPLRPLLAREAWFTSFRHAGPRGGVPAVVESHDWGVPTNERAG